jgi:hypothetical protein
LTDITIGCPSILEVGNDLLAAEPVLVRARSRKDRAGRRAFDILVLFDYFLGEGRRDPADLSARAAGPADPFRVRRVVPVAYDRC